MNSADRGFGYFQGKYVHSLDDCASWCLSYTDFVGFDMDPEIPWSCRCGGFADWMTGGPELTGAGYALDKSDCPGRVCYKKTEYNH